MLARVYLSLGSNLGDREGHIHAALSMLREHALELQRVSSVYATAPQDVLHQPWFLNVAAECTTVLTPHETLESLQAIEGALGRDRAEGVLRGPRVIDLDLLLYDELVIDTPALQVPHPRMTGRRFVLEPLLEIGPDLCHPATGEQLRDFLPRVTDQALTLHSPGPAVRPDPVSQPSR